MGRIICFDTCLRGEEIFCIPTATVFASWALLSSETCFLNLPRKPSKKTISLMPLASKRCTNLSITFSNLCKWFSKMQWFWKFTLHIVHQGPSWGAASEEMDEDSCTDSELSHCHRHRPSIVCLALKISILSIYLAWQTSTHLYALFVTSSVS